MTPDDFQRLVADPALLIDADGQALNELADRYPYSANVQVLRALHAELTGSPARERFHGRAATVTFDRGHLFDLLREAIAHQNGVASTEEIVEETTETNLEGPLTDDPAESLVEQPVAEASAETLPGPNEETPQEKPEAVLKGGPKEEPAESPAEAPEDSIEDSLELLSLDDLEDPEPIEANYGAGFTSNFSATNQLGQKSLAERLFSVDQDAPPVPRRTAKTTEPEPEVTLSSPPLTPPSPPTPAPASAPDSSTKQTAGPPQEAGAKEQEPAEEPTVEKKTTVIRNAILPTEQATPEPPAKFTKKQAITTKEELRERLAGIRRRQAATKQAQKSGVKKFARRSLVASDGMITATLAEVFIRQGQYQHAIRIYEQLALANPEKRPIFAALIKDLKRKL